LGFRRRGSVKGARRRAAVSLSKEIHSGICRERREKQGFLALHLIWL